VINNPILNSPFAEPSRHWELAENGIPTGTPASGRRRSESRSFAKPDGADSI